MISIDSILSLFLSGVVKKHEPLISSIYFRLRFGLVNSINRYLIEVKNSCCGGVIF